MGLVKESWVRDFPLTWTPCHHFPLYADVTMTVAFHDKNVSLPAYQKQPPINFIMYFL